MRPLIVLSGALCLAATGALAQTAAQPNYVRYQPNYEEVKAALGLSDEQIAKLKQMQQDKMATTQSFYTKMADKQKELNQLLEGSSTDAAKVGTLMIELQTLRKQPPPGVSDIHDKAVEALTAEQKHKLARLEEAQKMRSAVDQALQLALLQPVVAPPQPGPARPGPAPGMMQPMKSVKPDAAKQ